MLFLFFCTNFATVSVVADAKGEVIVKLPVKLGVGAVIEVAIHL